MTHSPEETPRAAPPALVTVEATDDAREVTAWLAGLEPMATAGELSLAALREVGRAEPDRWLVYEARRVALLLRGEETARTRLLVFSSTRLSLHVVEAAFVAGAQRALSDHPTSAGDGADPACRDLMLELLVRDDWSVAVALSLGWTLAIPTNEGHLPALIRLTIHPLVLAEIAQELGQTPWNVGVAQQGG